MVALIHDSISANKAAVPRSRRVSLAASVAAPSKEVVEASVQALSHLLRGAPAVDLGEVPEALWRDWAQGLVKREVRAGDLIVSRQQASDSLVLLLRGDAALGQSTASGDFKTERCIEAPAWLEGSAAWLGLAPAQDALAVSDCEVVAWPVASLAALMARHPALSARIVQALAREVRALTHDAHALMRKDAPARFAAWLVSHAEPAVDAAAPSHLQACVRLHARKRDIAAQLAITPETLSRLLRSFTNAGWLAVEGYTLRLLDVPSLSALAESDGA